MAAFSVKVYNIEDDDSNSSNESQKQFNECYEKLVESLGSTSTNEDESFSTLSPTSTSPMKIDFNNKQTAKSSSSSSSSS